MVYICTIFSNNSLVCRSNFSASKRLNHFIFNTQRKHYDMRIYLNHVVRASVILSIYYLCHTSLNRKIGQHRPTMGHTSSSLKRGEVQSKALDLLRCVIVCQLLNFDMCRLKKHAYTGLQHCKIYAYRGKTLHPSTCKSAFPRALHKWKNVDWDVKHQINNNKKSDNWQLHELTNEQRRCFRTNYSKNKRRWH